MSVIVNGLFYIAWLLRSVFDPARLLNLSEDFLVTLWVTLLATLALFMFGLISLVFRRDKWIAWGIVINFGASLFVLLSLILLGIGPIRT